MNLTKLFQIQKELDRAIIEKKGLQGKDLLPERILALQVELGECANEWRGFKFWSKDQKARTKVFENVNLKCVEKNPLLEEYVDCLHFVLSIGNALMEKFQFQINYELPLKILHSIPKQQFLTVFSRVSLIDGMYFAEGNDSKAHTNAYQGLVKEFFGLGTSLEFSWEEIEQAYLEKNKINHERQANGY